MPYIHMCSIPHKIKPSLHHNVCHNVPSATPAHSQPETIIRNLCVKTVGSFFFNTLTQTLEIKGNLLVFGSILSEKFSLVCCLSRQTTVRRRGSAWQRIAQATRLPRGICTARALDAVLAAGVCVLPPVVAMSVPPGLLIGG